MCLLATNLIALLNSVIDFLSCTVYSAWHSSEAVNVDYKLLYPHSSAYYRESSEFAAHAVAVPFLRFA